MTPHVLLVDAKNMQRFESRWMAEPMSGCWLWFGCQSKADGRGRISINGKEEYAPRVSWLIHRGAIPEGLCVLHACDNPPCVNPDHLFLGTLVDNWDDMRRKGRGDCGRGSGNGLAKLREEDVREIRRFHQRSGLSVCEASRRLTKRFKVHPVTIEYILRGRTWKHVVPE